MHISTISIEDLDTLRSMAIRTYTAAFGSKNKPEVIERYYEVVFAKAYLLQQLTSPKSLWYFAKEGDRPIAYLKLNIGDAQTEFKESSGIEIERIYVDIPYLGKGIGSKLLDFTISKAIKHKKSYIWLGVWEQNPQAISFYKKHGFKITGTHDYDMIAEIQTDYIMRLTL